MLFICVAIMLFVATIAFVLLVKNNIKNEFVSSENNCNKEALIEPNVSKHEPDNELIHDDDGDVADNDAGDHANHILKYTDVSA